MSKCVVEGRNMGLQPIAPSFHVRTADNSSLDHCRQKSSGGEKRAQGQNEACIPIVFECSVCARDFPRIASAFVC